MSNMEIHKRILIFAYAFTTVGLVFFMTGIYFEAASFGLSNSALSTVALMGEVFKETGVACGTIAGILLLLRREEG